MSLKIWFSSPMANAYRDVTHFGGALDTTFMPYAEPVQPGLNLTR